MQIKHDICSVVPLGYGQALQWHQSTPKTILMSILNVTPDSFSDGGEHFDAHSAALQDTIARHIKAGATIIDIGGQSSRPNAIPIQADEEIARVLPAIRAVRSLPQAQHIAISVDTYRAKVAEAAVEAGATIVNDVSAGTLDPAMLSTVARLRCTYMMMHMRGTPSTMANLDNCSYPDGVSDTVARELQLRLCEAIQAGIRRWRIIVDPGLGFAKDVQGNLDILRNLHSIKARFPGVPLLVGSSRKRFIGTITGVNKASDRAWGTAATVTAAIAGGADIVRVHDVLEMNQVVAMADAIFKPS